MLCKPANCQTEIKWRQIAIKLNEKIEDKSYMRTGKQCRERWENHLDPLITRQHWTISEDLLILEHILRHLDCAFKKG